MPSTKSIPPGSHLRLRFEAPPDGIIELNVESDPAIRVLALTPKGLDAFYKRDAGGLAAVFAPPRLVDRKDVRVAHERFSVPDTGWWYVVLVNESDTECSVWWDVRNGKRKKIGLDFLAS